MSQPFAPASFPDPVAGSVDRQLRSRLAATAVLSMVLVSVVALVGVGATLAGWLTAREAVVLLSVGCIVVVVGASVWTLLLLRTDRPSVTVAPDQQQPGTAAAASMYGPWSGRSAPLAAGVVNIEQRSDVFAKLSHRLQSLVVQLIHSIDQMEHELEDPELLRMMFAIDHLATLVRRQTENIAILGGEILQHRSDVPVEVNSVLRSAVAEIQRYTQVATVPIANATIQGHVVAEVIHLLSELLENATIFSAEDAPKVVLRARYVTAGLEIQIEDRGLGMDPGDIERINHLLDGSTHVDLSQLMHEGRIGLGVVRELAQRLGIGVRLQSNIYGGIDASVVVPRELLGSHPMPVRPARRSTPAHSDGDRLTVTAVGPAPSPPTPWGQPQHTPAPDGGYPIAPQRHLAGTAADTFPVPPSGEETRTAEPDAYATPPGTTAVPQASAPLRRQPGAAYAALRGAGGGPANQDDPNPATPPSGFRAAALFGPADNGVAEGADDSAAPEALQPPPLPQRRAQPSHLRRELLETLPPALRPIGGHRPELLADLQDGRAGRQAEAQQWQPQSSDAIGQSPADRDGSQQIHRPAQGDA